MKTNTITKVQLTPKTNYQIDAEGEGVIFSLAGDLDRVADAVAQDIGFPIEYGTWLQADAAMVRTTECHPNTMFVVFAVSESALADWKASR